MPNASRDGNNVPTLLATGTDGNSIVRVKVNESNHSLKVDDNTTGSDNGPTNALRDENSVPVLLAVSSLDGFTPVPVYADADGNLLIDSN